MKKHPMTTLCYVKKDDAYLMMHRISKKNDVNKDKWIGIGGHFEEGKARRNVSSERHMKRQGLR